MIKMIRYSDGLEGFFRFTDAQGEDHTMFLPTETRAQKVIDCKGEDWFDGKTILELGTAHGLIGRHFEKLGATVTYADARQELLDAIDTDSEKLCINHNEEWSYDRKWDLIIHFGTLYHVESPYDDLRRAFNHADEMFLETAVHPHKTEVYLSQEFNADNNTLRCGDVIKQKRVFNGYDHWEAAFNDYHVEEYLEQLGKTYTRHDDEDMNGVIGIVVEHECYRRNVYNWTLEDVIPKDPKTPVKYASIPPNYVHFRRFWHIQTP